MAIRSTASRRASRHPLCALLVSYMLLAGNSFLAAVSMPLNAGGHLARLIRSSRPGYRAVRGAAFYGHAFLGAFLLTGQTPPARLITDGVYSVGQAARGQQLYKAQCAACHGNAMEGTTGPPLAGDSFLSNWSSKSLENLNDKIQKTMPSCLGACPRANRRISRPMCSRRVSSRLDQPN
jgi:cytochrome c553